MIVDFTDKNPNVYYEAGLADAWKKDWIVLAQSTEDLTFDVRHIRCIQYSNTMGADVKLQAALENALGALKYTPGPDAHDVVAVSAASATTPPTDRAPAESVRRPRKSPPARSASQPKTVQRLRADARPACRLRAKHCPAE